jgi:hypothetical protein
MKNLFVLSQSLFRINPPLKPEQRWRETCVAKRRKDAANGQRAKFTRR